MKSEEDQINNILYMRHYYIEHEDSIKQKIYGRRKILKDWLYKFKIGKKCRMCKLVCIRKYVKQYEFHHKDPKTKEFNISDGVSRGYSQQRIKKELKKCVILCSECHKKL